MASLNFNCSFKGPVCKQVTSEVVEVGILINEFGGWGGAGRGGGGGTVQPVTVFCFSG
jgi:hypothetical protein